MNKVEEWIKKQKCCDSETYSGGKRFSQADAKELIEMFENVKDNLLFREKQGLEAIKLIKKQATSGLDDKIKYWKNVASIRLGTIEELDKRLKKLADDIKKLKYGYKDNYEEERFCPQHRTKRN